MTRHVRVAPLSEIPPGEGRTFQVESRKIAVFHGRDGRLFATQAECPHKGGPLADGLLGGSTLICPLHDWSFDLLSGMALHGTCGVAVYPVSLSPGGVVVLEIEEDGTQPAWRITDYTRD